MPELHEGGCLCGSVRYRAEGKPARVSVCHCADCQRRTGSAFAVVAHFKHENLEMTGGPLSAYEYRSDESHRWIRLEFCPRCGTTVTLTSEQSPGGRTVSGGTFDDPGWLSIERHVWTRSAVGWMTYPPGVETFEKGSLRHAGK
jgi:hypothetical protein